MFVKSVLGASRHDERDRYGSSHQEDAGLTSSRDFLTYMPSTGRGEPLLGIEVRYGV